MTSFETPQPIVLSIELSQGTVQVIASDRTDTVVGVSPSDRGRQADVEAAGKTVVDLANGTLSIRMPKPGGFAAPIIGWKRSGAVDVIVELPERSSLRADTGVADFRCDGLLGDVDVRTGVGNVRLDQAGAIRVHSGMGRFALEEASGDAKIVAGGEMTIGAVSGDADIKNINGRTWIGRVGGAARVRSANGDVTIDDAGGDVTIKTARGDVRLGRVARGSVTIETGMGELEIGIREGTAAWIDANTRFGRIDSSLSPAAERDQSAETVQVHARTAFGDVLITRS
jgi:Putative adhesin